jgi:hypothetical protein
MPCCHSLMAAPRHANNGCEQISSPDAALHSEMTGFAGKINGCALDS